MDKIAVLLTSFNRKAKTLACIDSILRQVDVASVLIDIFLVDDRSPDGTGDAVREMFPSVTVIDGTGSLYWSGGMRRAHEVAMSRGDYDFSWWVNDDTVLAPHALATLLSTYRAIKDGLAIVSGATADPITGNLTYGGMRQNRFRTTIFESVRPQTEPTECDTMNGNCVLIPREVTRRIGNLCDGYTHSLGDIDYGLEARRRGCTVWLAPGFLGKCSRNGMPRWKDRSLPRRTRWEALKGPKGLPIQDWWTFTRRNAGPLWPFWFAVPYASLLLGRY